MIAKESEEADGYAEAKAKLIEQQRLLARCNLKSLMALLLCLHARLLTWRDR
ncbi:hypothetical protein KCP73_09070 [Salmonella enterica subsp. enterica]|nr:hypothetical protein KCP73_09070 [Salmonella enterica subsp. enterica]